MNNKLCRGYWLLRKICFKMSLMKISSYFLFILLALSQSALAQDIDLLLLAGQSNSVGKAIPTVVNGIAIPGTSPFDARVRYYYDVDNTAGRFPADSGQTFGPLSTYTRLGRDELGHEFAASRRLVETRNNDLAVIKFSVGAASITRWQPGAVDYVGFINAVTDGVEELINEGFNVNVVGLAWHQGESDATIDGAPLYAGRLDTFISSARNDLNATFPTLGFDSLPVALVEPAQIRNATQQTIANLGIVDSAMMNFAVTDSNASFVQTSDIDDYIDAIHFDATGQQLIGRRIASALTGIPLPESPFIQPDQVTADSVFGGEFTPGFLIGQLSSEFESVSSPAASVGNAYASDVQSTAVLTMEFSSPQDVTDFVFWNYRNGVGNTSSNSGVGNFTLELFDGVGGQGNLIATISSDTQLAPQNGDIPAQIFSIGAVAEGVSSAILTIEDTDGLGFVGAHEVGFLIELTPVLLGDCNLDGVVDFFDISPFIEVLSSDAFDAFLDQADCNQDGVVNFFDISPFVAILSGGN